MKGYTRVSNYIIETYSNKISPNAFLLLINMIRYTIGYNRKSIKLSYTHIKEITSIKSTNSIKKAISELIDNNLIIYESGYTNSAGTLYSLGKELLIDNLQEHPLDFNKINKKHCVKSDISNFDYQKMTCQNLTPSVSKNDTLTCQKMTPSVSKNDTPNDVNSNTSNNKNTVKKYKRNIKENIKKGELESPIIDNSEFEHFEETKKQTPEWHKEQSFISDYKYAIQEHIGRMPILTSHQENDLKELSHKEEITNDLLIKATKNMLDHHFWFDKYSPITLSKHFEELLNYKGENNNGNNGNKNGSKFDIEKYIQEQQAMQNN